jgi:hypothetical protein
MRWSGFWFDLAVDCPRLQCQRGDDTDVSDSVQFSSGFPCRDTDLFFVPWTVVPETLGSASVPFGSGAVKARPLLPCAEICRNGAYVTGGTRRPAQTPWERNEDMYEAFDSFLAMSTTWHTHHPNDEDRFYKALEKVVSNSNFSPEQMEAYMRDKKGESHIEAIEKYTAQAWAVKDYLRVIAKGA